MKFLLSVVVGLFLGILGGYLVIFYTPLFAQERQNHYLSPLILSPKPEVIGFLPYWLLGKASNDYSSQITTHTYFGLTVGEDGSIVKLANEQEEEPGWATFKSDLLNKIITQYKQKDLKRSLLVFSGEPSAIDMLVSNPEEHAKNLTNDVIPLMKKYGFSDLNLDIESVKEASESARENFTTFVKTVKTELTKEKIPSLTIEVSGNDVIKPYLIDEKAIAPYVDHIVLMAYDFHYSGSSVTGAVAPLFGAGITAEFDTQAAIEKLRESVPAEKIILGIPLYGYEWETLDSNPKSAIIPGTGITASNKRVEAFINSCATCSAQMDTDAKEKYVVYHDNETNTYHQIFFPDSSATQEKVNYAKNVGLGGIALWALGYEGNSIMEPLKEYIR